MWLASSRPTKKQATFESGINKFREIQKDHSADFGFYILQPRNWSQQINGAALQALIRHQSPMTTDRYINFAQQINPAVQSLYVPDVNQM